MYERLDSQIVDEAMIKSIHSDIRSKFNNALSKSQAHSNIQGGRESINMSDQDVTSIQQTESNL